MLGVVKLNSLRDICFILLLRGRVQIHSSHLSCFGYARSSRFKPRSPPHHISLYIPTIQHSLSKQSFARWNLWLKYLHHFLFILQFYTNVSLPLHCCFSLSLSLSVVHLFSFLVKQRMLKFYCIQILQQHLENTSSMGSSNLWPESHVAYLKFITTSYFKKMNVTFLESLNEYFTLKPKNVMIMLKYKIEKMVSIS